MARRLLTHRAMSEQDKLIHFLICHDPAGFLTTEEVRRMVEAIRSN